VHIIKKLKEKPRPNKRAVESDKDKRNNEDVRGEWKYRFTF
jgi:hypothetical protein